MELQNIRDHVKAQYQGPVKFHVLIGSDDRVHLVVEVLDSKNRIDVPLTPSEAGNLAAMLLGGANQVQGIVGGGAMRLNS